MKSGRVQGFSGGSEYSVTPGSRDGGLDCKGTPLDPLVISFNNCLCIFI